MSKEIELRAWDGKRMIYLSNLVIGLKKSKRVIPYAYFESDTFEGHVSLLNHHMMEYVGLHDNRGIRIYEDDIVSHKGIHASVKYCIQGAQFQMQWIDSNKVHRYANFNATYGDDTGYYQCDDICIIGNVHQNPELLNQ